MTTNHPLNVGFLIAFYSYSFFPSLKSSIQPTRPQRYGRGRLGFTFCVCGVVVGCDDRVLLIGEKSGSAFQNPLFSSPSSWPLTRLAAPQTPFCSVVALPKSHVFLSFVSLRYCDFYVLYPSKKDTLSYHQRKTFTHTSVIIRPISHIYTQERETVFISET